MKKYPEKFKHLFEYGREGLMRTEEFTPDYLEFGFSEEDVDLLVELVFDEELNALVSNKKNDGKLFAPIHSVMVLGQLKAQKPLKLLLEGLDRDENDDYYKNAVLYYFRKIGNEIIEELVDYFLDDSNTTYNRTLAIEAFDDVPEKSDKVRALLEDAFVIYLKRDSELDDFLNAFAIFALIDLSEDAHIELIRKVYKTKPVNVRYDGDLEEIEMRLGLRTKRDTPKSKNMFGVPFGGFKEDEISKTQISDEKIGRNEPCPCGSGKKYKKCCLDN